MKANREKNQRRGAQGQRSWTSVVRLILFRSAWFALPGLTTGCVGIQSALDPAGPQAAHIEKLWRLMLYVMSAVFIIVFSFVMVAAFRRRQVRANDNAFRLVSNPDAQGERRLWRWVLSGTASTVLILFVFLIASFLTGRQVFSDAPNGTVSLDITGYQWWWQVKYNNQAPNLIVTTANEIHIPVGKPILITLKSNEVIHSFWVPNLHGKTDLIPGHINQTWLQADRPGSYRGQCAEFCGYQHAHMAFTVVAEPQDKFDAWYKGQVAPAIEPGTPQQVRGRQIFMGSRCIMCHRIQGTEAGGNVGPDLTHVASRQMIGAGTLLNTRDNLSSWITDPQQFKPGNRMPANPFSPEDLQALVEYLQSLK